MKTFSSIVWIGLLFGLSSGKPGPLSPANPTAKVYISEFENVLGTSMELKVLASAPSDANQAEGEVLGEINRLSKILSAYDRDSEFSRWMLTTNQPVRVSQELFEVLSLFDAWRIRSGGALDASAEIIGRLWKKAAAEQRVPSAAEIKTALQDLHQSHWKLDPKNQTATHLSAVPLMLNSFAKSYIIRKATDAAMASGKLKAIVLNIGGDLVVSGDWDENIQISNPKSDAENESPLDQLVVRNRAVATSGNYRRGELIGGHWYSHIVDPRTGIPADNILSATVVAPDATDAGALATAFNVLTPSESQQLAASIPGVEYLIITKDNRRIYSKGWDALEIQSKAKVSSHPTTGPDASSSSGWQKDFELLINFEINLQKQGFVKRPYIAIWVEDENHAPVRTITVWHGSERYLPELKSWYMKYRSQYQTDPQFNHSVTSATRSAGKYSVKWDGKDDKGNEVPPGKYFIKIEASREHGTYQLMRQEILCDNNPKTISLDGNIEISAASLDYRKKTPGN